MMKGKRWEHERQGCLQARTRRTSRQQPCLSSHRRRGQCCGTCSLAPSVAVSAVSVVVVAFSVVVAVAVAAVVPVAVPVVLASEASFS